MFAVWYVISRAEESDGLDIHVIISAAIQKVRHSLGQKYFILRNQYPNDFVLNTLTIQK